MRPAISLTGLTHRYHDQLALFAGGLATIRRVSVRAMKEAARSSRSSCGAFIMAKQAAEPVPYPGLRCSQPRRPTAVAVGERVH
jgi:hypothetical protein